MSSPNQLAIGQNACQLCIGRQSLADMVAMLLGLWTGPKFLVWTEVRSSPDWTKWCSACGVHDPCDQCPTNVLSTVISCLSAHFLKCTSQLCACKILEKSLFNICIRFTYMDTAYDQQDGDFLVIWQKNEKVELALLINGWSPTYKTQKKTCWHNMNSIHSKNTNSNHHTSISCYCYYGFLCFGLPLRTDILD